MPNTFPTNNETFFIEGPAGKIECQSSWPESAQQRVMIICHPHPLYEGSMHNKVVTTLARAGDQCQLPTLRFNFRGVGNSAGSYGEMAGEIEDCLAVVNWTRTVLPNYELVLAGFSFGSFISASVANQIDTQRLINIAPAVNHADFNTLTNISCPWLVIQGDRDEVIPPNLVFDFCESPPAPLELIVMHEAGHFFHGRLVELREFVIANLNI